MRFGAFIKWWIVVFFMLLMKEFMENFKTLLCSGQTKGGGREIQWIVWVLTLDCWQEQPIPACAAPGAPLRDASAPTI